MGFFPWRKSPHHKATFTQIPASCLTSWEPNQKQLVPEMIPGNEAISQDWVIEKRFVFLHEKNKTWQSMWNIVIQDIGCQAMVSHPGEIRNKQGYL